MHTDARDPHGQDLPHIIETLGLNQGQVLLSTAKVAAEELSLMYNAADFTINIADAEGFGLGTLESLACGTPIIVNMTGGLQEQVTDGQKWFGIGLKPASKAVIGSLQVPYIYEDRVSKKDFIDALSDALEMNTKMYRKMSRLGQQHVQDKYNFEDYESRWVEKMNEIVEKHGSWESRQGYDRWHVLEVSDLQGATQ